MQNTQQHSHLGNGCPAGSTPGGWGVLRGWTWGAEVCQRCWVILLCGLLCAQGQKTSSRSQPSTVQASRNPRGLRHCPCPQGCRWREVAPVQGGQDGVSREAVLSPKHTDEFCSHYRLTIVEPRKT